MTRLALASLALAALPVLSRAQPASLEHARDRAELRQDRRELADDRRDAAWMEQLLARFDAARAGRARGALAAVENEALRTLDRERQEARAELARSHAEVRRDARDPGADRRDLRDDRRDRRDDRRDLARVEAIRSEFWSLRGRMDRRALDRKRSLLVEMVRLARAELREDHRELREDRREEREDRRRG